MTLLTKKWIGGILLLGLIAGIASMLMGWRAQEIRVMMGQQISSPVIGISMYQELQLSDVQKKQIQALEKEYQKTLSALCERHCSAKLRIGVLLQSGKTDEKSLLPLAQEVGRAYSECEQATLRHVAQICDLLTSQQKTIFLKQIADHIAATCPKEFIK